MNTSSSFIKGKIYPRSKLYPNQIFPHTINLYNEKFDWLFIVDPIWLAWNTYISHSLTDSLTYPRPITCSTRRLRGIFLQKNNSKNSLKHYLVNIISFQRVFPFQQAPHLYPTLLYKTVRHFVISLRVTVPVGRLPHKKETGRFDTSQVHCVQPQKGAFAVPFRVVSRKKITADRWCVVSELLPIRGDKNFKPCQHNKILDPLN